jgi:hypothetical protein
LHTRLSGASGARHSLRPLIKRVRKFWQTSGASGREIAKSCVRNEARTEIESKAIHRLRARHALARHHPPPGLRDAPPDDGLQRAIQYSGHVSGSDPALFIIVMAALHRKPT